MFATFERGKRKKEKVIFNCEIPLVVQPPSNVCVDKKIPFSLHTVISNCFDLYGASYMGADYHTNISSRVGTRNVNVF